MLLIVLTIAILIIRNSRFRRKKLVSIFVAFFSMAIITIFSIFPAENLFATYKTPESVFNYANSGTITEIIHGENSCMVIYSNGNNAYGHYIIPKTDKGYKIPSYFTSKKISHKFDKSGLFDIYNVCNTKDYYVFGTVHLKEYNEIYVLNGNGDKIKSNIFIIENTDFIYFYLPDFSNEHCLSINGEIVLISNNTG